VKEVVAFDDDFSIGLINPSDPKLRTQWAKEVLGDPYWSEITAATKTHVAVSLRQGTYPVVWYCAARLAAIPAGESPANRGVQSLL
jgi:hypothetical protein